MQIPGITINSESRIRVTRRLPVAGEVLVQPGQQVEAPDVVARTALPHRYRVIDIARQLAQTKVDMPQVMLKAVGDMVEANEVIAAVKGGLPFLQRRVRAPAAGYISAIGPGWVLLETERTVVEIQAFINGVVTKVTPQREVVIEAKGAIIEAACGFGGEAFARLQCLVGSPFESIPVGALTEEVAQTILLGGRSIDEAVLRQAEALQVQGIIVGRIDASLLKLEPPVRVRVVATEGFGHVPMSPYTFAKLIALSGRKVSIRGLTPAVSSANEVAEADTPIILATSGYAGSPIRQPTEDLPGRNVKVGSRVRVIRGELLGVTGHVDSVPAEPQPTESGLVTPGAYIDIDNQLHFIPLANLEQVI